MHRVGIAALGALAIALVPVSAVSAAATASAPNACTLVTKADASKALRTKVEAGTHAQEDGFSMCTYKYRYLQLKVGTRPLSRAGFSKAAFALRGLEFGVAEIWPIARASYYRNSLTVIIWKQGTELLVRVTGVPKEYTVGVVETVAKPALSRL